MSVKWTDIYKSIIGNATIEGLPVSGFFELTARCNFHCKMCYICSLPEDKSFFEKELTTAQWISIGQEARDAGLIFLTLTGGEIFLRKDFLEIYDAYSEMGFNITLFTNGSLITPEKARWLGMKPPSKVSITLYGANPETYGKVTGHPEGFEKTITAIKALQTENIRVEIKSTVIKDNAGEFEAIHNLANSMGIDLGIVNYVAPRREGCGTDPENNRLEPKQLAEYEKMIHRFRTKLKEEKKSKDEPSVSISDDIMIDTPELKTENEKATKIATPSAFRCSATKCAFWLAWDGRLSPCGLLTEPSSNVLMNGFTKSWEQLKELGIDVPTCKVCTNCDLRINCMSCPARLKAETGYFDKPAPYLCELAKARKDMDVPY